MCSCNLTILKRGFGSYNLQGSWWFERIYLNWKGSRCETFFLRTAESSALSPSLHRPNRLGMQQRSHFYKNIFRPHLQSSADVSAGHSDESDTVWRRHLRTLWDNVAKPCNQVLLANLFSLFLDSPILGIYTDTHTHTLILYLAL